MMAGAIQEMTSPLPKSPDLNAGLISDHKAAHEALAKSRTPGDFRALVNGLAARYPSREFFNNPRLKFLHDACTLAQFVKHKTVDRVRLARSSDQWPDGFIELGQATINVEITIALMPGRKMGDEYKFDTGLRVRPS